VTKAGALVIGVSSRALFDLEEENRIFEQEGLEAYRKYQLDHEEQILRPGTGFSLIKALLGFNQRYPDQLEIRVVVMSRNSANAGIRILRSVQHYGLAIRSGVFSRGEPLSRYLEAFQTDLFLSKDHKDVQTAIDAGFAAAVIYDPPTGHEPDDRTVRLAFDADAVIFSEESERIYKEHGIEAFLAYERKNARKPLPEGPFAKLFKKLSLVQPEPDSDTPPIRIAIVSSRNFEIQERVIRTLRAWEAPIDQAFFLGGLDKAPILAAIRPHIFFDDQDVHVGPASHVVPAARVPYRAESGGNRTKAPCEQNVSARFSGPGTPTTATSKTTSVRKPGRKLPK